VPRDTPIFHAPQFLSAQRKSFIVQHLRKDNQEKRPSTLPFDKNFTTRRMRVAYPLH
jgi:hypothetical protein